jgi:glycosyltransferase involved in cell wall biosynthesis
MGLCILFLIPYPLKQSPSQRFRFEQYFEILSHHRYTYQTESFLPSQNWQAFYKSGKFLTKLFLLLSGFFRRLLLMFRIGKYDLIFIHRESAPIGPPIFEWIITKIFQKKIIYDFDDAIWLTDRKDESILFKLLKGRNKVASICTWAHKVSCGNEYLANYARQFNNNVICNPTTIDTENWHNPQLFQISKHDYQIAIGWTGSHSTLKYLNQCASVMKSVLDTNKHVKFLVIADVPPVLAFPFHFIQWKEESEISDLLQLDIGIMPLPDDEWTKGKCGFKALQYMALEIPVVASPVGVNQNIIIDGVNGFLASKEAEWYDRLNALIADESLRRKLGKNGRKTIISNYSVRSNAANFLSLFHES